MAPVFLHVKKYSCFIQECKEKFIGPSERTNHCVSEHKFPKDFRFDIHNNKQKKGKTKDSKKYANEVPMESDEVDGDKGNFEGSSTNINSNKTKTQLPKKISFGQSSSKSFYRGKKFTSDRQDKSSGEVLDSASMVEDLKNNLPE